MTETPMNDSSDSELMGLQLANANTCLDTADLITNPEVKARCIAQATEAQNVVANWLLSVFNASFLLVGDPVPEPSTYALLALGLGFIGARSGRRKSTG